MYTSSVKKYVKNRDKITSNLKSLKSSLKNRKTTPAYRYALEKKRSGCEIGRKTEDDAETTSRSH